MLTTVHGEFAKKQILAKNDSCVFVDWNPRKDLIISDLVSFFRSEKDLLKNREFRKLLGLFPSTVKKNIRTYLILNEISSVIIKGKYLELSKNRIKKLLK